MNLIGETVMLRAIELEDLEILRELRNEHFATNIFRQYRPLTSKDQDRYWERVVNHENFVVFAICIPDVSFGDRDAREITYHGKEGAEHYFVRKGWNVIGEARVGYINWRNRWAELGIFVGKEYMGRGYGREALYILLDYSFRRLDLHAIRAETVTPRVREIFEEFGFTYLGETKGTTYMDGYYRPDFILELYESEWFKRRADIYENGVRPHFDKADTSISHTLQ